MPVHQCSKYEEQTAGLKIVAHEGRYEERGRPQPPDLAEEPKNLALLLVWHPNGVDGVAALQWMWLIDEQRILPAHPSSPALPHWFWIFYQLIYLVLFFMIVRCPELPCGRMGHLYILQIHKLALFHPTNFQ